MIASLRKWLRSHWEAAKLTVMVSCIFALSFIRMSVNVGSCCRLPSEKVVERKVEKTVEKVIEKIVHVKRDVIVEKVVEIEVDEEIVEVPSS